MSQGVGIRIGDDYLEIAALERRDAQVVLVACARIECSDRRAAQKRLERWFNDNRLDRHAVAVAISAKHCIFRTIVVPFSADAQISQIIYSAAEPHIQSYAIEDLVIDYQIMGRGNGKTRLLAVAARKDVTRDMLELIEFCGIYPYAIEVDIFGLVHCVKWRDPAVAACRMLLLDIEPDGLSLALLENGAVSTLRRARFSVRSLLDGVASAVDDTTELQISPAAGLPGIKFHERVLKELRRILAGLDPVERIYLSGPGTLIGGMPDYLALNGISAAIWDIGPTLDTAAESADIDFASAPPVVGLALKALGQTAGGVNLRRGDFAYARAGDLLKVPLAIMLTLLSAIFFFLACHLHSVCREQSRGYDSLTEQARAISRRIDSAASLDGVAKNDVIYHVRNRVEEICRQPALPPLQDACVVWGKIFQALHGVRQSHLFTVESLSIDQEYVQFAGRSETDLVLDAIKHSLTGADWIAPGADSLRVLSTAPATTSTNPRLKRQYKYQVQLPAR